jgi:hypothetical protein
MHSALRGCSCCADRGTHTPASSPTCLTIGVQVLLTYERPDVATGVRVLGGQAGGGPHAIAAVEMRIRCSGVIPVHLARERNIRGNNGLQERNPPGNRRKSGV